MKKSEIESDGKLVLELKVTDECENVDSLEHVIANISFSFTNRGDLKFTLISPHHTPSEILSYRKNDHSPKGATYFPFMTLFNWGESPKGVWKLVVESRTKNSKTPNSGQIDHFSLVFYGTKLESESTTNSSSSSGEESQPKLRKRFADLNARAFRASEHDVREIYENELNLYRQTRIINKRVFESNPELKDVLKNLENSVAAAGAGDNVKK